MSHACEYIHDTPMRGEEREKEKDGEYVAAIQCAYSFEPEKSVVREEWRSVGTYPWIPTGHGARQSESEGAAAVTRRLNRGTGVDSPFRRSIVFSRLRPIAACSKSLPSAR